MVTPFQAMNELCKLVEKSNPNDCEDRSKMIQMLSTVQELLKCEHHEAKYAVTVLEKINPEFVTRFNNYCHHYE